MKTIVKQIVKSPSIQRLHHATLILISSLASIILVPTCVFLLCIVALFRQLIKLILKIRYGSKFGGLVEGCDTVHTTEDLSKSVTNCLVIYGYDETRTGDELYEKLKPLITQIWFRQPDPCERFKFTFKTFMGYAYRLKCNMSADDCIKKMKKVPSERELLNKKEFLNLMSECCNSKIPVEDKIFWEILISTQPIEMKEKKEDGKKYYPMLFRIHHAITDGVSILRVMTESFGDDPNVTFIDTDVYKDCISDTYEKDLHCPKDNPRSHKIQNLIKSFLLGLRVFLLFPYSTYTQLVLKGKDYNILHGRPLSNKKVLGITLEESPRYVKKVKQIKSKFQNVTFPDVMLTALSASLSDYYRKRTAVVPEYICSLLPVLPGSAKLQTLTPGHLGKDGIQFKNGFSMILPDLFMYNPKRYSLIQTLKLIAKENETLKNSVDYYVNYITMGYICPLLPKPLSELILLKHKCTAVVSILAGPTTMTCGKHTIDISNVGFWAAHFANTGVSFSVLTYGGRLHVGLSVDKTLISNEDEVQNIVDGVFTYLDKLEEDSKSIK